MGRVRGLLLADHERSMSRPHGAVTLREIAAVVGVTPAAASMALSGSTRISQRTRDAVREAADSLGYVPSSAGRALRSRRSDAIALVVPNTTRHVFGHAYFMHVLTGVSDTANAHDMQVIVSTNPEDDRGLTAYERVMRSRRADGAIVTSAAVDDPNIERLTSSGIPVVLIGNYPHLANAVSIGIDDRAASAALVEHLVTVHGRRRLLHVTGPLDHQTAIDRRDGVLDVAHRMDADVEVIEGDFGEASAHRALRGLGERLHTFDGFVMGNDDMAFAALVELRRVGIRVPEDASVVGFDDFGLARTTTPGITTIRVPAERMARLATQQLLDLIAGGAMRPGHTAVDTTLVRRGSCGCAEPDPLAEPAS